MKISMSARRLWWGIHETNTSPEWIMTTYILMHTDENGERHQLSGAWEAASPEEAIDQMLSESGFDDDGQWTASIVTDESDVI